jgi:hypothetical protein
MTVVRTTGLVRAVGVRTLEVSQTGDMRVRRTA